MVIYDVKKKQNDMKKYLRTLRKYIRKDDVQGMCIVVFKNDKTLQRFHFDGDISLIEWIGAMEAIKTYYLDNLLVEE